MFIEHTIAEAKRYGHDISPYVAVRFTEDGRVIGVVPLLLGQGQIVMGDARSMLYTDEWMYATLLDALHAYTHWDGAPATEPLGWTRHKNDQRPTRRRYYDEHRSLVSEEERE